MVMANPSQVQQIFMNLCTNAAHAMESRGGVMEINITDEFLELDSDKLPEPLKPGEYMKIEITDNGTGIPENIIGSIFEPFFTTKAPGEGTGMGLSVVHGIVKKFGGHISAKSQMRQGTVFTTFLPVTREPEEASNLPNGAMLCGSERVLVVDDDLQLLEMAGQALRRLGYSVSTQSSSVAALRLFRAKPHDFDLVISDMTMPKMTGDDLAVELLKIRPNLPIIVLTGYSKKISEQLAAEIGIKAFAYKPLIKRDLAEMVRKVLDEAMGKSVETVTGIVLK
jgi:CheY-like chemotaxis protein